MFMIKLCNATHGGSCCFFFNALGGSSLQLAAAAGQGLICNFLFRHHHHKTTQSGRVKSMTSRKTPSISALNLSRYTAWFYKHYKKFVS